MAASLRLDLLCDADPVRFARACGLEPDLWQAKVLRSKAKRALLNCSRQAGKSTTIAVRAAHRAIYRPKSLILCVSPTDRQSGELFDKVAGVIRAAPTSPKRLEDNARSLRLENGSRVVSLPGSSETIRGYSAPSMVLVDEAAYVDDSLMGAVRPMLIVSGGELWLFSTPYGKRGEFYEAWEFGGDEYERHRVPATECPRISAESLEAEKRTMPSWLYAQEYGTEFMNTLDSVFTAEQVSRMVVPGEELQL